MIQRTLTVGYAKGNLVHEANAHTVTEYHKNTKERTTKSVNMERNDLRKQGLESIFLRRKEE
jgi:hypothetical protein